jgi:mono/diheme cytochrome c family protein
MPLFALPVRGRKQWPVSLLLLLTAVLSGLGLASCDGGSATPTVASNGTTTTSSGDAIYSRYCNTCHPGGGRGVGPSLIIKNLSGAEIKAVVRHGKAQMPGFGPQVISDDDLDALVEYVIGMRR